MNTDVTGGEINEDWFSVADSAFLHWCIETRRVLRGSMDEDLEKDYEEVGAETAERGRRKILEMSYNLTSGCSSWSAPTREV